MKKIPVGATIAHAYRFAFRDFFNILKLTWLPLAITYAAMMPVQSQITRIMTSGLSAITMPWPLLLLIYAASAVLGLMMVTAVFQYALGQIEMAKRWTYFPIGRPMWRLFGAFLLTLLALTGVMIALILATIVILFLFRFGLGAAHISAGAIKAILGFDTALAFLIGYCVLIFCTVRFGALLFAATIAENRIGLGRAWTLSHGNFWRLFVIALAVFLPCIVVQYTVMFAVGWMHLPSLGMPAEQLRAQQLEQSAHMIAAMQHYWYIAYPIFAGFTAVFYGLMAGGQAFAYRALTEDWRDTL